MESDKAEGEGREPALLVRDGLLECPNCGGDHFTTLRVPQKNLFNGTLAQPGRRGLVLTGLPPFIVTTLPTNTLPLFLRSRCGYRRDARATYVHTLVHKHMYALKAGMQMCVCAHATIRSMLESTSTRGHPGVYRGDRKDFDDSTGQINHVSIINAPEVV